MARKIRNISSSQTEEQQPAKKKKRSKLAQKEMRVLKLIHENHNVSRLDLAKMTGASAGSMTAMIQRLIGKGLVVESTKNSANLGRKPVALSLRKDLGYVVGVDLGSYLTRVAVTDVLGSPCYKSEFETRMGEGRDNVIARTFKAIRTAISENGMRDAIKGIGMAHSGVIDAKKGMVLGFPRPGQMTQWRNVPLREMLEEEFRVSSVLDDSARMMAVAERHFGLGREMNDFLFIEVGMGIGAAIFIDGKLYRGPGGSAGEFGHMTVDENGPPCSCGNTGCLEAMASCAAIIQAVKNAVRQGVTSKVPELVEGDLDRIGVEAIVQAAKEHDTLSIRVLHEAVSRIGVILADVINLLNPSFVIFAGPLFRNGGDFVLDQLKEVIRRRALEKSAAEAKLLTSALGSEAAALGAARFMSEQILETIYQEKALLHRRG